MTKDAKKKAGLISVVILILAVFMLFMNFSLAEYVDPVVESQSFNEVLKQEINNSIPNAGSLTSFKHKSQFLQLNDEIMTEKLLEKIDDASTQECLELSFEAYMNYALGVCKNILKSGNWNRAIMTEVKDNCKMLLESPYCKSSEKGSLNHNIEVVDNYFIALSVIVSSNVYSGIDKVKQISQQAINFQGDIDLKVCEPLMLSLAEVPGNLYKAHVDHVRRVISNSNSTAGNAAVDEIRNVANIYGKSASDITSDLSAEINKLESKTKEEVKTAISTKLQDVDDDIF